MVDAQGNFAINDFRMTLSTTTIDYVVQKIRIKLRTFLGEWYLDTSIGIPYFQIIEKNSNLRLLEALAKQKILEVDGVSELLSFDLEYTASIRRIRIKFRVRAENGDTGEGVVG